MTESVSPVMQALYRGDNKQVAELRPPASELDLFEAAALGEPGRVRELLAEAPHRIDELSPDGFTALHLAAFFGRDDVVDVLLEHGAPLEKYAEADFAPVTPLGSAAAAGRVEVAQRLLDAGANVNVRGRGAGFTPLHSAAQNNDAELARLLLGRGADPTARTDEGRTPADLATDESLRELLR